MPSFDEPAVNTETSGSPALGSSPEPDVATTADDDVPLLEPALENASAEAGAAPRTEPFAEPAKQTRDRVPQFEADDAETVPALDEDLLPTLDTALPAPCSTGDDDDIPTLYDTQTGIESPFIDESHADPEPADRPAGVPAWDREPTMAELRPDLTALERAMANAQGNCEQPLPEPAIEPTVEDTEEVPEITLDDSIRRKIDIAEAALQAAQTLEESAADTDPDPVPDVGPAVGPDPEPGEADAEKDRISAELARAKSIEDVDDKLAETLFGEEFSMIAAEVAASVGTLVDGDEDPDTATEADGPIELALAHSELAETSHMADRDHGKNDGTSLERKFQHPKETDAVEVSMETTPSGLSLSATQRLATVRALNAANTPAANGDVPSPGANRKAPKAPDSIEDQINVSITQTLTSLDPATIKKMQEAEAENEEKKGGFLGRFRRYRP